NLCNRWRTKWRRLVSGPVHYKWERRQDGVGELKGRWEFSCGNPEIGLQLIEAAAKKYPESDAPYAALSEYYYSIREIDRARGAEATGARLSEAWAKKLGEF